VSKGYSQNDIWQFAQNTPHEPIFDNAHNQTDRKIFERFLSIATALLPEGASIEGKERSIGGTGNLKNRRVCVSIAGTRF